MAAYPNLRARYSKGKLKLLAPLNLPEGTEVLVSVTTLADEPKRRPAKRRYAYPSRPFPLERLGQLAGTVSLGGNALEDSEAIYDGN